MRHLFPQKRSKKYIEIILTLKKCLYFDLQYQQRKSNNMNSTEDRKINRKQKIGKIRSTFTNLLPISSKLNQIRPRQKSGSNSDVESLERFSESPGYQANNEMEVFAQKYELKKKIGVGSNGIVYQCLKKRTEEMMAVKCFKVEDDHLIQLKNNFRTLRKVKHSNILRHQALYIDMKKHQAWLVMELISHPALEQVKLTKEEDLKFVMLQLCEAITYLHRLEIVHRDVKPENILIDPLSKKIKLVDFGISKHLRKRGSLCDLWTSTGTIYFKAPEMFGGGYREGVDVWAAGVSLFWLICGYTPFQSTSFAQTLNHISKGKLNFPQQFEGFSNELKEILQLMLTKKATERPPMSACLKHQWFSTIEPKQFHQLQLEKNKQALTIPYIKLIPSSFSWKRQYSDHSLQNFQGNSAEVRIPEHVHFFDSQNEEEFSTQIESIDFET